MYPHVCDQPALLKRITYRLCFATNTETFGNRFTFSYFQFNFSFSFSFLVFCFLIFCLSLIFIYPAVGGRHDKCRDFLDIQFGYALGSLQHSTGIAVALLEVSLLLVSLSSGHPPTNFMFKTNLPSVSSPSKNGQRNTISRIA